jgi:hypothetical protein
MIWEGSDDMGRLYKETVNRLFSFFIVAPCIMESIYCPLTNKCTFIILGKVLKFTLLNKPTRLAG